MSPEDETIAAVAAVVAAIRGGDLEALRRLIDERPDLATARVNGRTALHVVTDWPGYYPNGPAVVALLVAAGADPNADTGGNAPETGFHSVIESPDSVRRVAPPTSTMIAISAATANSHHLTARLCWACWAGISVI